MEHLCPLSPGGLGRRKPPVLRSRGCCITTQTRQTILREGPPREASRCNTSRIPSSAARRAERTRHHVLIAPEEIRNTTER